MVACLTITQHCPDKSCVWTFFHANPLYRNTFQLMTALMTTYNYTNKTHKRPPWKHAHIFKKWGILLFTYSVTPIASQKVIELTRIQTFELILLSTHGKNRLGNKRTHVYHICFTLAATYTVQHPVHHSPRQLWHSIQQDNVIISFLWDASCLQLPYIYHVDL